MSKDTKLTSHGINVLDFNLSRHASFGLDGHSVIRTNQTAACSVRGGFVEVTSPKFKGWYKGH